MGHENMKPVKYKDRQMPERRFGTELSNIDRCTYWNAQEDRDKAGTIAIDKSRKFE